MALIAQYYKVILKRQARNWSTDLHGRRRSNTPERRHQRGDEQETAHRLSHDWSLSFAGTHSIQRFIGNSTGPDLPGQTVPTLRALLLGMFQISDNPSTGSHSHWRSLAA